MKYVSDAFQDGSRPAAAAGTPAPAAEASKFEGPVSAALLGQALDAVSEGTLVTDADQNIVYANKAFESVTGYSLAEVRGRNCRMLQGPGSDPETIAMMRAVLGRGETFRCEILNYRKNGTPFWNGLTISAVRDSHGVLTHFVSVQRDITAQRAEQEQLRFLALHDPVTGLPNRTALDQYLSRDLRPGDGVTAVGIIDLDDFKVVNDVHGHEVGDALLTDFASRLRKRTRDQDFLARLGGDEFVIVVTDLTLQRAEDELVHIMEALHDAVDTNFTLGPGIRVRVGMSMGLALCPAVTFSGSAALRRADIALYQQKAAKSGRERWWRLDDHFPVAEQDEESALLPGFAPPRQEDSTFPAGLAMDYRSRLFDGGLRMYFQPIVDLRSNETPSVEALTRLVLEDGSVVSASKFLPLLSPEDTNALLRAGLDEALNQVTVWESLGFRLNVSVNVSPSSLANPDCARWVAAALSRHSVSPDRLILELLETHSADEKAHRQGIQELLDHGVSLALDDLGSGHSTLMRLAVLPFNTVKIDRKLLLQFTTAPVKTMTFLATMISMGQDMGWAMVAEGLEDASLTEAMRVLGVPYGQGFHLARPMPAEQIPAWIAATRTSTRQSRITTSAGALAYHWQFNRLKTPHLGSLHTCPLTAFLTGEAAAQTASELHQELHTGPPHNTRACDDLLNWLVNHVTAAHQNTPGLPFRQPDLLGHRIMTTNHA